MSNYPPGVDANTTDAPWNQPDPKRQTKTITGYVRFAGVYKRKIEVPVDFDTSDSEAVSDALHDDCQVNRPAFAQDRPGEEYGFWNWTLGEFAHPSPNFRDPGLRVGKNEPRIFIDDVEED